MDRRGVHRHWSADALCRPRFRHRQVILAHAAAAQEISHVLGDDMTVDAIPDSGQRIAEENPEAMVASILRFDHGLT